MEITMENVKEIINQILMENKLKKESNRIVLYIPEIKYMMGFDHRHPHHNLDVWKHTIKVVEGLQSADLEVKMAGLLHDIGKPFSYQEDNEIRHFHGHPNISAQMSEVILTRIGYEQDFIDNVCYLVKMHDTIIDPDNITNSINITRRLLQLQYADAKAHHPDKIEKRLAILQEIERKLEENIKKKDIER